MIRKYKSLLKSWELERPKPVLPFPEGIACAAPTRLKDNSSEWQRIMGPHDRWPAAADEMGWAVELTGLARATEELSLCVDTVLARTEMGEPMPRRAIDTLVACLQGLLACWDRREVYIVEVLLPWLEPLMEAMPAEKKELQKLKKCYQQRRKRVGMLCNTFSKVAEAVAAGDLDRQVNTMRMAKDSFDVYQGVCIAASQMEVESAMWGVRSCLSQAEFLSGWRAAARRRGAMLRTGALALRGADRSEIMTWLQAENVPQWLCGMYAFGMAYVLISTWRKPLKDVMEGSKYVAMFPKLFHNRVSSS